MGGMGGEGEGGRVSCRLIQTPPAHFKAPQPQIPGYGSGQVLSLGPFFTWVVAWDLALQAL